MAHSKKSSYALQRTLLAKPRISRSGKASSVDDKKSETTAKQAHGYSLSKRVAIKMSNDGGRENRTTSAWETYKCAIQLDRNRYMAYICAQSEQLKGGFLVIRAFIIIGISGKLTSGDDALSYIHSGRRNKAQAINYIETPGPSHINRSQ
ncbi:hypothetical protein C922_04685 [Plasmodium inui San Antonio 1]|uniref:Uncharacterized protein n=1 Tax=Plasmodium inui San Antonio 1 TaxID=1237626 RepID=W7A090_9APIC|nr:hypothetical protein C922_04685 [Plasmodium inui San Antonio 1]EUD64953.1 hypothetical protein C922_04685 [Plasmodium inui San Antonio 1]